MREIKFRGKRTDNGEWVYGFYNFTIFDDGSDELMAVIKQHIIADENGYVWSIDKNTVGQYTGMKDKNVKEIYEGDVVEAIRYDELVVTGVVEFRDCSFVINTGYQTIYTWMDYQIEIIGNIHDNPELLVEDYD